MKKYGKKIVKQPDSETKQISAFFDNDEPLPDNTVSKVIEYIKNHPDTC